MQRHIAIYKASKAGEGIEILNESYMETMLKYRYPGLEKGHSRAHSAHAWNAGSFKAGPAKLRDLQ